MPRTKYNDPDAEKQFQSGRDKLKEGMAKYNQDLQQEEGESIIDADRRRAGLDAYSSGDYDKGTYRPTKMRK